MFIYFFNTNNLVDVRVATLKVNHTRADNIVIDDARALYIVGPHRFFFSTESIGLNARKINGKEVRACLDDDVEHWRKQRKPIQRQLFEHKSQT